MSTRRSDKFCTIFAVAFACALFAIATSHAAPPANLDRYAARVLDTFETPGMVVVISERDRPSVVRTYGVRRMGEATKVDEQTLFARMGVPVSV